MENIPNAFLTRLLLGLRKIGRVIRRGKKDSVGWRSIEIRLNFPFRRLFRICVSFMFSPNTAF